MKEGSDKTRTLKAGDEAPDFSLPTHNEGELNLAWYRGRHNVVIAFYPGDWTPICSQQIPGYQRDLELFNNHNCQLLCISVDSVPCHKAWAKSFGELSFPLMADFWPHGEVSNKFGVLSSRGYAERVVFLIDMKGIIRFIEVCEIAEVPDSTKLFRQLALLSDEKLSDNG